MVKPSDRLGYTQHGGDISFLNVPLRCFEPRQCERATITALNRIPIGLVGHDFHHRTKAAKFFVVIPDRCRAGRANTCRTFACRLPDGASNFTRIALDSFALAIGVGASLCVLASKRQRFSKVAFCRPALSDEPFRRHCLKPFPNELGGRIVLTAPQAFGK